MTPAHTTADPLPRAAHASGTAFLGMVIFIASWVMLFAGLFFAYGLVRVRAAAWPPPDLPALPVGLPALATAWLVGASLCLHRAVRAARAATEVRLPIGRWLAAGLLLGLVFLGLQLSVWRDLWTAGLRPETGTYASAFYTLTVFHGLHVLVGVFGLGWLIAHALVTRRQAAADPVRLWTLYWHMVGAVWIAMFVLVYLL